MLRDRGYVEIQTDQTDARRKVLRVTALGFDAMREGEAIFEQLRARWIQQVGRSKIESLEATLATLVKASPTAGGDAPDWMPSAAGPTLS